MKKFIKLITKADIFLISSLLIISGLLLAEMKQEFSARKIEIRYRNNLIGTYSLNEAQIIDLDDGIQVEIKNNKVRMKKSTCKHQYCVQQGWSNGLPIICVPNEIAVNFISNKAEMLITR